MRVIPQPGQPLHSLTIIVLLRDDVAMGQCSVEDRFCGGTLVAGVKGNLQSVIFGGDTFERNAVSVKVMPD